MKRAVIFLITVYVSVPIIIYLFPWILGHVVYSHLLKVPFFVDLSRPDKILNHTTNLYLPTEEGVSVGVWHTLPVSQWEHSAGKGSEWYQEALADGRPVIVYLHGNTGTRAIHHRVELVKILSAAGYHVVSFDYRGFGDSSGEPSEAGLTTDALYLYRWAKQHSGGSHVYLWGHSLGTGVATNAALQSQEEGSVVDALILEAPYTSIRKATECHVLAKMFSLLPGVKNLLTETLEKNKLVLASDENLKRLESPLLVLHAEDDNILPYHMGQELYQIALGAQKGRPDAEARVQMVSYRAALGYAHDNIYLDPDLVQLLGDFLKGLET
ncbi:lysophosphatidylserine lipase ABHD12-like [Gadus chalcogrammus]|uniref:lysophosphatidylserine lipase ABHD12-like n=1 Tax=Gadus chalcogrammus TaxID=1042646 RepID=UPI0024C297FA|nr:lysophosphatidylserine lipase ABHD12-like [Gadus chalcogrammus]